MKRKFKIIIGFSFILSMCVLLNGCTTMKASSTQETSMASNQEEESYTEDVFAMDTYMTLTAYGKMAKEAVSEAKEEITRIENLVSTGIETSEIAQINREGKGKISDITAYLLERSFEINEATQGAFDLTIYPLMEEWGFTSGEYQVPKKSALTSLLKLVGMDKITLKDNQVVVNKKGTKIDLGGIAKGYTSARVMDIFKENGVSSAVISLGGNVQVLGAKTNGESWRVAIENPDTSADYLGVLKITDKAVITSGGYERYFEKDGKSYHHILNPSTGYPAESGLTSVTIVSADGTLADGLSTALFVMGKDKAIAYWNKHKDEFDAILLEENGILHVTEGIANQFSSEKEVIVEKGE